MKRRDIVVGVDGSPAGDAALAWAATEAARRGCELTVVHVFDWRVIGARAPLGGPFAEDARTRAEALVASAVADARALVPGLAVHGEALRGSTGATLVAASASTELVVLGSRGRGGFASLLLGSVGQQVATHASGPVVIVRGRPEPTGPIVVGVDGSDAADEALGIAFEEARTRGAGVVAIRVYAHPTMWGGDLPPVLEDSEERRKIELEALLDDLGAWKEKYGDVAIEAVVLDGHPAEVLTGLSSTAQLMVVGTRGHGGFSGLLLGSVSLQLLHHSDCPVLITRSVSGEIS